MSEPHPPSQRPLATPLGSLLIDQASIAIACRRCERKERFRALALLKRFGPNAATPDVLRAWTKKCPNAEAMLHDRCAPYVADD